MKRIILLLCTFTIISCTHSQNLQKSIWGCKFGCNKATVEATIKKLGFKQSPTIGEKIKVTDIEFCGRYFDYVVFSFYLDQLHTCEFHVNLKSDEQTQSYVDIFKTKYGRPQNIDTNKIHYYEDYKNSIIFQGINKRFMIVFWNDEILNKSLKGE